MSCGKECDLGQQEFHMIAITFGCNECDNDSNYKTSNDPPSDVYGNGATWESIDRVGSGLGTYDQKGTKDGVKVRACSFVHPTSRSRNVCNTLAACQRIFRDGTLSTYDDNNGDYYAAIGYDGTNNPDTDCPQYDHPKDATCNNDDDDAPTCTYPFCRYDNQRYGIIGDGSESESFGGTRNKFYFSGQVGLKGWIYKRVDIYVRPLPD